MAVEHRLRLATGFQESFQGALVESADRLHGLIIAQVGLHSRALTCSELERAGVLVPAPYFGAVSRM
ncbi:MAG: hypothetical protein AMXMBFR33_45250 [Candidatus Xenobia bacterium]